MPKNEKLMLENKKPVEEVRYLEEQKLSSENQFTSPIFNYGTLGEVNQMLITLSGISEGNIRWKAREIRMFDMPNYKKLLSDEEVMKYYHQEVIWGEDRIEKEVKEWVDSYYIIQFYCSF